MRVRLPCLPLVYFAPMVKWTSSPASNRVFRVQVLVGVLACWSWKGYPNWRREPVGSRPSATALRVRLPPLPPWNAGPAALRLNDGVCGVADSARLAVNQKVAVRPRPDTPIDKERQVMVAKVLQRPTLVLNRNWQPVNVA